MFPKLLFSVVILAALAAASLGLRQQQRQAQHESAQLHGQIDRDRQAIWELQTRLASQAQPERLQQSIQASGLKLAPAPTERQAMPQRPVAYADIDLPHPALSTP